MRRVMCQGRVKHILDNSFLYIKKDFSECAQSLCLIFIGIMMVFCSTTNASGTNAKSYPDESINRISNHGQYLIFEERVQCQKVVEEVYWSFRIWPEQNKQPKPPLSSVLAEEQIRAKVEDVLKKSNALDYYWQRPITGEQLQAEMERMARHTQRAEMLHRIWASLNNDPFLIAECFARPVLADRLIRNWYAFDERFHGELKKKIQNELKRSSGEAQIKTASDAYFEMEWLKSDEKKDAHHRIENNHKLVIDNEEEWKQLIDEYSRDSFAPNKFGQLQEDENRFFIIISVQKETNRIKIEMMEWKKISFEEWWNSAKAGINSFDKMALYSYRIPAINDESCENDTWRIINQVPVPRVAHSAVWTGTEMIIWGGECGSSYPNNLNTGGRYNPATDSWIATSTINVPTDRYHHTAVWTGTQMIIWGGSNGSSSLNTGGKYNPSADSWIATSTINAPLARSSHTAVWTGTEMIIWGDSQTITGGRYTPGTDSWVSTSTSGAPSVRFGHAAVWTGTEMIIWGGTNTAASYLNTGGKYNPNSNTWIATSTDNAPTGRLNHTAVWTGTEMIIWGGWGGGSLYYSTGGRYNPASDSWVNTSTVNAPPGRQYYQAVWTSTEMIAWGGANGLSDLNTGGKYNPASDLWIPTSTTNAPSARRGSTLVWTGNEMIVWGGSNASIFVLNTGGKYNPSSDSWVVIANANIPSVRKYHTAVWTGIEMIIWGGYDESYLNTGGRYDLAVDSWIATSTINVPIARDLHTAIWTGTEMIIWGGYNGSSTCNTGGRYNPASDLWIAISTSNAPTIRDYHTAIWTGTEMIIWGGYDGSSTLRTGGKYNPISDTWIATSTANAPTVRKYHTAVWTGAEMIIWGGEVSFPVDTNTGARYNPVSDSWIATSTINAPTARALHTAVWTDAEMIIWGDLNTGGKYNPSSDSWIATSTMNAPAGRDEHTAVWTGAEMIIWGGGGSSNLNTGGKYNPASDSWIATSTSNAPIVRGYHTAIWTGTEMIIWGGEKETKVYLNDLGRYCACTLPPSTVYAMPSPGFITIDWSLITGIANYDVYRKYLHCSQEIEELLALQVVGDTYIDDTVAAGKGYQYNVTSERQCEFLPKSWVPVQSIGNCILQPCFSGIENIKYNQCAISLQWHGAVSDCESAPLISYTVYWDTSPDFIPAPSNQIATCFHDTFYVDRSVTAGITYYYIVRAEDSSSNGSGPCNNGNIDSNLIRRSAAATFPNITLFFDGFESGIGNWTSSSNWQQTDLFSHTGNYSAYPMYENNLQCVLMTKTDPVSIPADATAPALHFWTRHNIENGADAGVVEGSPDGNTWNKLALTPDYPGSTSASAQACLGINPQLAFTGYNDSWVEYISDLSSYAGNNFKMRFNFATNDSITSTGWFIDDVSIDYLGSSCATSGAPSGTVQNSLKVTKSNGNPDLNWTDSGGTCTVTSYAIYRGSLPWTSYNHSYLTCNVSAVPPLAYTDASAPASYYYLVVPLNNIHEGSYGTNSYGTERPQGISACKWQNLLSCPGS